MNEVTKDLLEALGDCLTFIEKRHAGNWVPQQARAAIARAEAPLAEPVRLTDAEIDAVPGFGVDIAPPDRALPGHAEDEAVVVAC